MTKIFLLLILLVLADCSSPVKPTRSDVTIATANLLVSNTKGKEKITSSLLLQEADVLILNEACPKINIDTAMLRRAGYELRYLIGSNNTFSMLVASRTNAQFESVAINYSIGSDLLYAPFGLVRILSESDTISVIGAHFLPPIYFSESDRNKGFEKVAENINNGIWTGDNLTGDPVVVAGDFNAFPSDDMIQMLLDKGLEDGALVNPNPYDYTFIPLGGGGIARIDYTLVSQKLQMRFQENFKIPGSDHKGVKIWIDFR